MNTGTGRRSGSSRFIPWSRRTIVAAGIVLIGMVLFGFAAWWIVPRWASRDWVTVEGTIVSSQVERDMRRRRRRRPGQSRTYTVWNRRVEYEYAFDGRVYRGDRVSFELEGRVDRDAVQAWVDRHRPGTSVDVIVDPERPTRAVLERGDGRLAWSFFWMGLGWIAFGVLVGKRIIVLDSRLDLSWDVTEIPESSGPAGGNDASGAHPTDRMIFANAQPARTRPGVRPPLKWAAVAVGLSVGVWQIWQAAEDAWKTFTDDDPASRAAVAVPARDGGGERTADPTDAGGADRVGASTDRRTEDDGAGDGLALPVGFTLSGDVRPWSVEGRYSGRILRDGDGLVVRLSRGVIRVRPAHTRPVTVGDVRAALGRREGGDWTFFSASDDHLLDRRLEPGDSIVLDPGLEFRLPEAEPGWLVRLDLVFEHSLLRPGATDPYGWTWAAGRAVDPSR